MSFKAVPGRPQGNLPYVPRDPRDKGLIVKYLQCDEGRLSNGRRFLILSQPMTESYNFRDWQLAAAKKVIERTREAAKCISSRQALLMDNQTEGRYRLWVNKDLLPKDRMCLLEQFSEYVKNNPQYLSCEIAPCPIQEIRKNILELILMASPSHDAQKEALSNSERIFFENVLEGVSLAFSEACTSTEQEPKNEVIQSLKLKGLYNDLLEVEVISLNALDNNSLAQESRLIVRNALRVTKEYGGAFSSMYPEVLKDCSKMEWKKEMLSDLAVAQFVNFPPREKMLIPLPKPEELVVRL